MFESVRNQIRELVRDLEYVITIHADEEMENDGLTIFDVENAIFSGEIIERQRDLETNEWKYLFTGRSLDDNEIIVVGKISLTGKLVIITVYTEDNGRTN